MLMRLVQYITIVTKKISLGKLDFQFHFSYNQKTMKKNEWIIIGISLILTLFIDQLTKRWMLAINAPIHLGVMHFILHYNEGAMLGLFSELPAVLRIVTLSTGGAFLVCTYAIIQYLLPVKSLTLRIGLSILLGGILGNVTDRILWGHVVDFIIFSFGSWASPAFNMADALQWVGYGFIVYALFKEGDLLWPTNDIRKQYWVNKAFQLKYCFVLMGIGLGLALISGVFAYTYLRVAIIELVGTNAYLINKFLRPFVITYCIISVAFCAILFTVGKLISHRIAGPIYAFEKYLLELMSEKDRSFKLREKDEFKNLERIGQEIKDFINKLKQSPES